MDFRVWDDFVTIWRTQYSPNAYLDVRRTVGGQVDVEAVVVVVITAQLLVDQDHPVVLYRLGRLNDGTHGWQGRHIPLHVATWVVHCRLDERTVVLYVQDTEWQLIFWICVKIVSFYVSPRAAMTKDYDSH